jgi:hypothetical protein
LTIKFTQPTAALRPLCSGKFHDAFRFCSSLPTVIADRGAPAESKALIKLTLCYSPCSYPMLFSCQKSSASKASHLGGLNSYRLSVLGCQ